MPDTARILHFPHRGVSPISVSEARERANSCLESLSDPSDSSEELSNPEVLLAVCLLLREQIHVTPVPVAAKAVNLYRWISRETVSLGVFDEKDYFLGETALIAAGGYRLSGNRNEVELWLDRAEAGFRHTVNPSPLLANVTYERLALRCEKGAFEDVAELAPSLANTFARLGMPKEQSKCRYLEAVALKQAGRVEDALRRFDSLVNGSAEIEVGLKGLALSTLADIHAAEGHPLLAIELYQRAVPMVVGAGRPSAVAHLKSVIGETFRSTGQFEKAIEAFEASIADYERLSMSTMVAYLRLVLAQVLIEAGRAREAEWQILAALPTVEEQKMVPEGVAAVALLRESVRQRRTDPQALSELRMHIQSRT